MEEKREDGNSKWRGTGTTRGKRGQGECRENRKNCSEEEGDITRKVFQLFIFKYNILVVFPRAAHITVELNFPSIQELLFLSNSKAVNQSGSVS